MLAAIGSLAVPRLPTLGRCGGTPFLCFLLLVDKCSNNVRLVGDWNRSRCAPAIHWTGRANSMDDPTIHLGQELGTSKAHVGCSQGWKVQGPGCSETVACAPARSLLWQENSPQKTRQRCSWWVRTTSHAPLARRVNSNPNRHQDGGADNPPPTRRETASPNFCRGGGQQTVFVAGISRYQPLTLNTKGRCCVHTGSAFGVNAWEQSCRKEMAHKRLHKVGVSHDSVHHVKQ